MTIILFLAPHGRYDQKFCAVTKSILIHLHLSIEKSKRQNRSGPPALHTVPSAPQEPGQVIAPRLVQRQPAPGAGLRHHPRPPPVEQCTLELERTPGATFAGVNCNLLNTSYARTPRVAGVNSRATRLGGPPSASGSATLAHGNSATIELRTPGAEAPACVSLCKPVHL